TGFTYAIGDRPTTFGRRSSCDIQIEDERASREHFQIERHGAFFVMRDLKSRNGTKVNDHKTRRAILDDGDRVRVGDVEYSLSIDEDDVTLRTILAGRYDILERIGEGGMGVVYRAKQLSMDRMVALKVLSPVLASKQKHIDRFIDEARAAGRLNHPNVIQVHDVESVDGVHYFAMEFIDGATCQHLVRDQGPLDPAVVLHVLKSVAKALAFAHDKRLVHRDVKPDNIMVRSGDHSVKLADLGISASLDQLEDTDNPQRVAGTPHYIAPEAAAGKSIDHRVDVYSLGATAYHLLSGNPPYTGKKVSDVFAALANDYPPSLEDTRDDLPPALIKLVDWMMTKDPDHRPQTIADVLDALPAIEEELDDKLTRLNETLVIRRRADNGAEPHHDSGGQSTPLPPAPTSHTSPRKRRSKGGNPAPRIAVAVAAVVILIFGINVVRDELAAKQRQEEQDDNSDTAAANKPPRPVTSSAVATPTTTTKPRTAAGGTSTNLNLDIRQLRERLGRASSPGDIQTIQERLGKLRTRAINDTQRNDLNRLSDECTTLLTGINEENERTAFATLREQVNDLKRNRDYRGAQAAVNGFTVTHNAHLHHEINLLLGDLARLQEDLERMLRMRIDLYRSRNDLAALQAIRQDDIPAAMADHPLTQELDGLIAQLNQAITAHNNDQIPALEQHLSHWHVAAFRDAADKLDPNQLTSAISQRLSELRALADDVSAFTNTLDQSIQAAARPPRSYQPINGVSNADITGANEDHLVLRPPGGGAVRVSFTALTTDELVRITGLIIDGETGAAHRPLFERIITLNSKD
ncbi:MAG: protein kinase domain-containing protein, partial [Planctomycetota bacterium]